MPNKPYDIDQILASANLIRSRAFRALAQAIAFAPFGEDKTEGEMAFSDLWSFVSEVNRHSFADIVADFPFTSRYKDWQESLRRIEAHHFADILERLLSIINSGAGDLGPDSVLERACDARTQIESLSVEINHAVESHSPDDIGMLIYRYIMNHTVQFK